MTEKPAQEHVASAQPSNRRAPWPLRALRFGFLSLITLVMLAWGTGAIYFSNLPSSTMRAVLASLFSITFLVAFAFVPRRGRTLRVFLIAFGVLLLWWINIPPSNHRTWAVEAAVVPTATLDGDRVTIKNVRNFHYRTNEDYDVRYEDRSYDLNTLRTVDFIVSHFGVEEIAHTFLSFGFEGNEYLALSIEVRKEKGEDYSPLKGIFKQYELLYVAGDERDVIRLRTNIRNEDVFLYRVRIPPEKVRILFLDYLHRANKIAKDPEFYSTVINNCTTNLLDHTNSYPPYHSYNWEILLNGYTDLFAYQVGAIHNHLPFEELKQRSRINDAAKAADDDPAFSTRIREHLSGI